MKGEIKKIYQEFINHIEFPAIFYVYENNRVLAINNYAKGLVGDIADDIRCLFDGKKFKISKEIINGRSKLLLNVGVVNAEREKLNIDIDLTVLKIDNVHFILMLFEDTIKGNFTGQLSVQTPRVAWKYVNCDEINMNMGLINDIKSYGVDFIDAKLESFLDEEMICKINNMGNKIIDSGKSQFNSIQMITSKDDRHFIKIHKMPIVNNAGDVIGILSVHNRILNRENHRALFDSAIKSNNLVNEIIDKGDTVFISWLGDEKTTIQYISPNIVRYGYSVEDFSSGKLTFKDLIYKDDFTILQYKFKTNTNIDDNEVKTTEYEYRIVKASGECVWIHEECTPVVLGNNIVYNFSSLRDITSRKKIENELNEKKKEYQLKKDSIIKSNDVDLKMFKLEELFDFNDIKGMQKLLSEVMYLISFIVDNKGSILSEPITTVSLNDALIKLINSKRSKKIYKEIGAKAFKQRMPIIEEFYCNSIKITAIPFFINEVYLGSLVTIALVGSTEINISDKNSRKYTEYIKIFSDVTNKDEKEFRGIVNFLWEHVQTLCRAEHHNLELIKEKNNLRQTTDKLEDSYQILEAILDNIDSCICVVTPNDYIIKFANKKIKERYSYDIEGMDLFAFLIGFNIESRSNSADKYSDINVAIKAAWNREKSICPMSRFYDNINRKFLTAKIERIKWIDGLEALLITMNDINYMEENDSNVTEMYKDSLTGLPNRLKFEIDAKNCIMNVIKKNKSGAVMLLEVDDFKHLTYRFGHEESEKFLKKIAEVLRKKSKGRYNVYRCRGVEFVILVDCDCKMDIDTISEDLIDCFKKTWTIAGEKIYCSISMGITVFPKDGINPRELLKNTDLALLEAKKTNNSMKNYYKSESR